MSADLRAAVEALADEWQGSLGRTWIANCGDDLRAVLATHAERAAAEAVAVLDAIKAVREAAADERVAMHERGEALTEYSSGVLDGIDRARIAGTKAAYHPKDRRAVTSVEEWWACEDAYQAGIDWAAHAEDAALAGGVDAIAAVLADLIADHPMWDGIDYTMAREARIADFIHEVSTALAGGLADGCESEHSPGSNHRCSHSPVGGHPPAADLVHGGSSEDEVQPAPPTGFNDAALEAAGLALARHFCDHEDALTVGGYSDAFTAALLAARAGGSGDDGTGAA